MKAFTGGLNAALRADAQAIYTAAIGAVLPDAAVREALDKRHFDRPVTVFAIGKAAWRMARAAGGALGDRMAGGLVITKYGHCEGAIPGFELIEAGHPVPDAESVRGARRALDMARGLGERDEALLLLSGGGSALFECPADGVTLEDIAGVTRHLLRAGADIREINCVRKRLSAVKGGRFAEALAPARLLSVVVSDVIGDPLDVIASGPAYPDASTCEEAFRAVERYRLPLSEGALAALSRETPKSLPRVKTVVTANVETLCEAAARAAETLGYSVERGDTALDIEAREAGRMLARKARALPRRGAFICGGETVVYVCGNGKGGRNQEVALSAAEGIAGADDLCVFAVGSDGTDGPTDAAGGLVTGDFFARAGADAVRQSLLNNDAYPLLRAHDALITTGPTGTNVNDLYVAIRR